MKKILISVLIILLLILSYFALAKGIGFLKIKSINDIKNASIKLENDFNEANELSSKIYPSEVETLESAIKQLKISKQEYENKKLYSADEDSLGTIEIKTYKIHYLWTILGNYRKEREVQSLTLDLKSTETEDVYDLEFTLVGGYTNITDFIYDIENDEQLNFEIQKLAIEQYAIETQTTTIIKDDNGVEHKESERTSPFNSITVITSSSVLESDNNEEIENQTENPVDTSNGTSSQSTNKNNEEKKENSETETIYDPKWVEVKFTVENVGITLD